jgi:putative redox protein
MKDSVSIQHRDNMSFMANINGHELFLDASHAAGGNNRGPRPKSLMMAALAGCTGMDVVSILKKMQVEFEDFRVKVEGNITEDHPTHFDHMHIIYSIKGKNIPPDKVNRAINLSQEKYCGVSYSYRKAMKITHELIIEESDKLK